jgi:predicted phage terminase large subunit-like protein
MIRDQLKDLSIEELQQVELELERKKVKEDLLYLCREYLGYEDLNDKLHGEMADELARLTVEKEPEKKPFFKRLLGRIKQAARELVLQLPRSHLKSSVATVGWTIQRILNNQNITIGIVNAVYGTAVEFLKEIQGHLLNERLVALFPDILSSNVQDYMKQGLSWRENIVNVKRTKVVRGNTVEAMGIDASMAGKHFDILIFDDIQNEINSANAQSIQKVIYKYKNCYSVLKPGGIRLIIGTKWAKEDFYYWLVGQGYTPIVKSCAVSKETGEPCSVLDDDAEPIFPEMFSIEELRKLRKEQGAYFFSCQYENNPLPDEEVSFKEEWIHKYETEPDYKHIYILVDPALSKTRAADETVFEVVGQSKIEKDPLYVLKSKGVGYSKTKGDVTNVINILFDEYQFYAKSYEVTVGIETAAFQHILKQWIEQEQKNRKIIFSIVELKTGNRNKESRIQRLQPLFENGGILLHPTNCETLITQLLSWPSSTHDDHPDALAYILDVLQTNADVRVLNYTEYNISGEDPHTLEAALARIGTQEGRDWRSY